MSRLAITGGTGLIGSALVTTLEARGDEVVVQTRRAPRHPRDLTGTADTGETSDRGRVANLDAVIHLAGAGIGDKRWTAAYKRQILLSRVDGTRALRNLWGDTPPVRLIAGSAIGYYGSRGDDVVNEVSTRGEGFLADVCEAWEAAGREVANDTCALTTLRTGIVLSKSGGALGKQLTLFKSGLGGRLGSGRQWMSPISLHDTVRAIIHCLDAAVDGPVNVVIPEPCTNRDFTAALGSAVHRPALTAAPSAALRLALGREMADELLLISQRVVPDRLVTSGFVFDDPTVRQAIDRALTSTN